MVLRGSGAGCPGEGDFGSAGDGETPTAPLPSTEDGASRATTAVSGAPPPHLPQPPAAATAPPRALQGEETGVDGRGAAARPTAPPAGSAPPPAAKPAPPAQPLGADGTGSGAARPDDGGAPPASWSPPVTESTVCGELSPAPQAASGRPAATSPSSLSPFAQPFHPRERSRGRSKARRWAEDEDGLLDVSDTERTSTASQPPTSTRLVEASDG
ncbi:lysine-rich arabinogalactan protein 19-like [Miscanthus floridulus]|uniref:lysine-rich arabinogalactan protein 19-like n=1 Tax=Miscanthus floridulus TaxID=154761 RepID=UPI003459D333